MKKKKRWRNAAPPTARDEMFIDDSGQDKEEDISFYRSFENWEEYPRFRNQTNDPVKAAKEPEAEYFGEDNMPELFDPEEREDVTFDSFESDSDKATKFKQSLVYFSNVENHFFYAVVYGILFDKLKGQVVKLEKARKTLKKIFLLNWCRLSLLLC